MLAFLLVAALVLMFLPALLSVVFASAHPLAIVWNFGWYALMGYMAAVAFQTPSGFSIGLTFAMLYVFRLIATPMKRRNTMPFEGNAFWINRTFGRTPGATSGSAKTFGARPKSGATRPTTEAGDVIEAEFRREP